MWAEECVNVHEIALFFYTPLVILYHLHVYNHVEYVLQDSFVIHWSPCI